MNEINVLVVCNVNTGETVSDFNNETKEVEFSENPFVYMSFSTIEDAKGFIRDYLEDEFAEENEWKWRVFMTRITMESEEI